MKRIATLFVLGSLTFISSVWAAEPNSTAASQPKVLVKPEKPSDAASGPTVSPAVRAAENAEQPGKMRPESAVVPQISLPLRSGKATAEAGLPLPGPGNGKQDDRAAACAAHISKAERQKCERSL